MDKVIPEDGLCRSGWTEEVHIFLHITVTSEQFLNMILYLLILCGNNQKKLVYFTPLTDIITGIFFSERQPFQRSGQLMSSKG